MIFFLLTLWYKMLLPYVTKFLSVLTFENERVKNMLHVLIQKYGDSKRISPMLWLHVLSFLKNPNWKVENMKVTPSAPSENHRSLLSLWELSNVLLAMKPQLFTKIIKIWEKKVNCIRVHVYHDYWFEEPLC